MNYLELNANNIEDEHICCAIADKKCREGYKLKKELLSREYDNGYRFYRLDERAKVFIEFGPANKGWAPINASKSLIINCLWVSGKYKGNGHGKNLLKKVITEAKKNGFNSILTITGKKKFHFMSDGKWLKKQGFEVVDETETGFQLLEKEVNKNSKKSRFKSCCKKNIVTEKDIDIYYSNRCPFTEFHVKTSLMETLQSRDLSYNIVKFDNYIDAQESPSPGTIFSLYYRGEFLTTDLSICMDSRFDKLLQKYLKD